MVQGMIEQLTAAARDGQLVRLYRAFEETYIRGYILDVGPEFFLLGLVSDRLWLDGFECFRVDDVDELAADPYADFAQAALAARGEARPALTLQLADIAALLTSAAEQFPLVTMHKERDRPEVCNIGKLISIEGGIAWVLEIGPDAQWDDEPSAHKLAEITRVNFGGDYEDALALIGGNPPTAMPRARVPLRLVSSQD
ncbi:hypothetical protein BH10PSE3_BH10PSE3_03500 [soil metagenome]